jgi:hypothetical protein
MAEESSQRGTSPSLYDTPKPSAQDNEAIMSSAFLHRLVAGAFAVAVAIGERCCPSLGCPALRRPAHSRPPLHHGEDHRHRADQPWWREVPGDPLPGDPMPRYRGWLSAAGAVASVESKITHSTSYEGNAGRDASIAAHVRRSPHTQRHERTSCVAELGQARSSVVHAPMCVVTSTQISALDELWGG